MEEIIKLGGSFFCPKCQCYHSSAMTCEDVQTMKKHNEEFFKKLWLGKNEEEIHQDVFTLTAEEVEDIKEPIQYFANRLKKGWLMEEGGAYLPPYSWEKAINNLFNKLIQWQNENNN